MWLSVVKPGKFPASQYKTFTTLAFGLALANDILEEMSQAKFEISLSGGF